MTRYIIFVISLGAVFVGAAGLGFSYGRDAGLRAGKIACEDHRKEDLQMLVDCATKLHGCEDDRQVLAGKCMEVCSKCPK